MKRVFLFVLAMLAALTLTAAAVEEPMAENVIYVDTTLAEAGDGTVSSPYNSYTAALEAVAEDTTVVLMSTVELGTFYEPAHSGKVTVTSEYGGVDYGGKFSLPSGGYYYFSGDTSFCNIEFAIKTKLVIVARFNAVEFLENVKMTGDLGTVILVGGSMTATTAADMTNDIELNILSGYFTEVTGCMRYGSPKVYNGNIYITVGGDASIGKLIAGSWDSGYSCNNAEITVKGGTIRTFLTGAPNAKSCTFEKLSIYVEDTFDVESSFSVSSGTSTLGFSGSCVAPTQSASALLNSGEINLYCEPFVYAAITSGGYYDAKSFDNVICTRKAVGDVYVADGGTGDGSSSDSPCGTLLEAVSMLGGEGGTVCFVGPVSISQLTKIPAQSNDLTFVADTNGSLRLGARLQFETGSSSSTVTLNLPTVVTSASDIHIFGCYNNFTFGEDFTSSSENTGKLCFYGGIYAAEAEEAEQAINEIPYTINVKNGTFKVMRGGSLRAYDSYFAVQKAPITMNIYGGTFGSGEKALDSTNKLNGAVSVSGMSLLTDDATLNIYGGTFNTPVYVQGKTLVVSSVPVYAARNIANDSSNYISDGDYELNIEGGTFNGGEIGVMQTNAGCNSLHRGNYTVSIGENAYFASGTVFDATQVKGYDGDTTAALSAPDSILENIVVKRFDTVNGVEQSYDEPLRILFIGDSITFGVGASDYETGSFPAKMLALAEAEGKEVVICNFSIPGVSVLSGGTKNRGYKDSLFDKMAYSEVDPDYVLFALGTNDVGNINMGGSMGTVTDYYHQYSELVGRYGELDSVSKVFITSSILRTGSEVYNTRVVTVAIPVQKRIAAELSEKSPDKYRFVDLYALTLDKGVNGELLSSDNLHPSNDGHSILAECVYEAIFNDVYYPKDFEMTDVYISASGARNGEGTIDSPISDFAVAIGRTSDNATVHVMGEFTIAQNLAMPIGKEHITFKGVDDSSTLTVKGDFVRLGSNTAFDDITLKTTSYLCRLAACYNDLEIKDTVKTAGQWGIAAGHIVMQDYKVAGDVPTVYDTVESVSSDRDTTIIINAGTYAYIIGGNRRQADAAVYAPVGTYSGNMELYVGKDVVLTGALKSSLSGFNYLTGKITAHIDSWNESVVIKDFLSEDEIGKTEAYDPYTFCTGYVDAILGENVDAQCIITCDFDGDKCVSMKDALILLKAIANNSFAQSEHYFGRTEVSLIDVLRIMKRITL